MISDSVTWFIAYGTIKNNLGRSCWIEEWVCLLVYCLVDFQCSCEMDACLSFGWTFCSNINIGIWMCWSVFYNMQVIFSTFYFVAEGVMSSYLLWPFCWIGRCIGIYVNRAACDWMYNCYLRIQNVYIPVCNMQCALIGWNYGGLQCWG